MTLGPTASVQLHGLGGHATRWLAVEPFAEVLEFDCDRAAIELPQLEAVLDTDELESLRRIRQPLQRRRATIVRGVLRWVLGAYLKVPPKSACLFREACGRPRVRAGPSGVDLRVSSARSGAMGVVAVARGSDVGVDLECVSRHRFPDGVAKSMLHARELVLFAELPQETRAMWLASAWVCKEATVKATGVGLGVDPKSVEVMSPEAPAHLGGGDFHIAGFPGLRGWLDRSGDVVTALVCSLPSARLRHVRLTFGGADNHDQAS